MRWKIWRQLHRRSVIFPKMIYLYGMAQINFFTQIDQPVFLPLSLLKGIDHIRDILLQNTLCFARGYSANNALLWGARGTGKSSLIKAVYAHVKKTEPQCNLGNLALVEISREDLRDLPLVMQALQNASHRQFLLFCDDLSFGREEVSYKSLKSALEGGLTGKARNCLFYATSNRRHLMARDMIENERSTAIQPSESVEENISLSDRFGLWLGFHSMDQDTYLEIIRNYLVHYKIDAPEESWKREAIAWSMTRGGRSGRVAWQFLTDLAGRHHRKL